MREKNFRSLLFITISSLLVGLSLYYGTWPGEITAENINPVPPAQRPVEPATGDGWHEVSAHKNETVYVLLAGDGSVCEQRVVNRLYAVENSDGSGEEVKVADYGSYLSVSNLTTEAEPELRENRVLWGLEALEAGDLYYEGIIDREPPVEFNLTYYLNGEEISAAALAGRSGRLEIVIKMTNKLAVEDPVYYRDYHGRLCRRNETNYVPLLIQGSYTVDLNKFSHIEAPGATGIVTGQSMIVSFMAFPYPEGEVTIGMYGEDIELNNFTFIIIPQLPPLPEVEMEEELTAMLGGMADIGDGLSALHDGADELLQGTRQLVEGIDRLLEELLEGVSEMGIGAQMLYRGADEMLQGLREFRNECRRMMGDIENIKTCLEEFKRWWEEIRPLLEALTGGDLADLLEQLRGLPEVIDELPDPGTFAGSLEATGAQAAQLAEAGGTLNREIAQLAEDSDLIAEKARELMAENEEGSELFELGKLLLEREERIKRIASGSSALDGEIGRLQEEVSTLQTDWEGIWQELQERWEMLQDLAEKLEEWLEQHLVSFEQCLQSIDEMLATAEEMFDKLALLPEALDKLVAGQRDLRDGIGELYEQGLLEMKKGLKQAENELKLKALVEGQEKVRDGIKEINERGIAEMERGLVEAVNEMRYGSAKIDKMRALVSDYRSYVDNEHNRRSSVQFIVQTQKVEKKQADSDGEIKDENKNMKDLRQVNPWQKFLDLFSGLRHHDAALHCSPGKLKEGGTR